ncbi:MAG: hypothetical protein L6V92_07460 [Phocaeicola vulgatus]|nr:MAG: hypothetical protein L6V92_07460 [Phocaeicola vulgatus]
MAISASIQALMAGEQVAGSKLNGNLLSELMAEGLLLVIARGSRKSYRARDIEALKDTSLTKMRASVCLKPMLRIPELRWLRRQAIPNLFPSVHAPDFQSTAMNLLNVRYMGNHLW